MKAIKFPEILKDTRQKNFLVIFGAVLFFFIWLYLIFKPESNILRQIGPQLATLKSELRQANLDITRIEQFKEQVNRSKEALADYAKTLPTQDEIPKLLGEISDMAQDINVKINRIEPLREATGSGKTIFGAQDIYLDVAIAIDASCGYHQLGSFINKLENSKYLIRVRNLKIKTNPKDTANHEVNFVVDTFVLLK